MKGDAIMRPEELDEFEKKVKKAMKDLEEDMQQCLVRNEVP